MHHFFQNNKRLVTLETSSVLVWIYGRWIFSTTKWVLISFQGPHFWLIKKSTDNTENSTLPSQKRAGKLHKNGFYGNWKSWGFMPAKQGLLVKIYNLFGVTSCKNGEHETANMASWLGAVLYPKATFLGYLFFKTARILKLTVQFCDTAPWTSKTERFMGSTKWDH